MDVSPNTAFNCRLEKVYWEMRKMLNWLKENCLTHLKHGTDNFHVSSHVCLLLAHESVSVLLQCPLLLTSYCRQHQLELPIPAKILLLSSYF